MYELKQLMRIAVRRMGYAGNYCQGDEDKKLIKSSFHLDRIYEQNQIFNKNSNDATDALTPFKNVFPAR